MHLIIFENGYVAAEFNFEAPRINRLGPYLFSKRNELKTKPVFLPLFQQDILEVVRGMPTINFLEIKGQPDAKELLRSADEDLANAYGTIGGLGADKAIHFGLTAQKTPDSKLKKLSMRLAKLAKNSPWDVRTSMSTLRVSGVNGEGKFDAIDLLEDHLIVVRPMERRSKKHKAVSSKSAYAELMAAYLEKKDELANAVVGRMLA
jgi:hypothetical protein